jgi:hypothetical protein
MKFPILAVLTFIVAFAIEAIGTYVSVIGLSTLFGANPVIISLAVSLDAGKLVIVPLLYTYWDKLSRLMRGYALAAATITMVITSAGAFSFLSGEFQKAILGTQEGALKVEVLKNQQAKYEERKKQIDAQIAALPEKTTVNQRLRLMNGFKAEQQDLQNKIAEIDKKLPELQTAQIGVEAKAGPILYIAKAFDIPVESAVKWVIAMIIPVFDPLAVFLIIAGNFLLAQFRLEKSKRAEQAIDPEINSSESFEEETPVDVKTSNLQYIFDEPESATQVATYSAPMEDGPLVERLPSDIPYTSNSEITEMLDSDHKGFFEEQYAVAEEPTIEQGGAEETIPPEEEEQTLAIDETPPAAPADREVITLSSLGAVKPDPHTVVDAAEPFEVGYKTGVKLT